jgi:hypothetical protein
MGGLNRTVERHGMLRSKQSGPGINPEARSIRRAVYIRPCCQLPKAAATFGGFFRHLNFAAGSVHRCLQRGHSQLLPSVSFSAPARIEPAQPFRICRYMLSISLNYFVAGVTGH